MSTIYELTKNERATMKKLIDMGLVVTIGAHARVRKDAKRYQHLRAQLPRMDGLWIAYGVIGCLSCWNGESADQAIDSAMKQKKEAA